MTPFPALDRKIFDRIRSMSDGKISDQLIDIFFENAPKKIEAALAAEKAGDYAALVASVHSLISSAGTLGAAQVQNLASQIQSLPESEHRKKAAGLLRDLKAAYDRVKPILENERSAKSKT